MRRNFGNAKLLVVATHINQLYEEVHQLEKKIVSLGRSDADLYIEKVAALLEPSIK